MAGTFSNQSLIFSLIFGLGIIWLAWQFSGWERESLPRSTAPLLKRLRLYAAKPPLHAVDTAARHVSARNKAQVLSVINDISNADAAFKLPDFLSEASEIFEDVMLACWRGDRKRLFLSALADDVFETLAAAISLKATRGDSTEALIVHLSPPQVIDARIGNGKVTFTLRLDAEVITVVRDATGVITAGDPKKVWRSSDYWTFARSLTPARDGWYVESTETGEPEAKFFSVVGQYRQAA